MNDLDLKVLKEYTIYDIVNLKDEQEKRAMRTKYYQYLRAFILPICKYLSNQEIEVTFSKMYGLTIFQMWNELKVICHNHQIDWQLVKEEVGKQK